MHIARSDGRADGRAARRRGRSIDRGRFGIGMAPSVIPALHAARRPIATAAFSGASGQPGTAAARYRA